MVKSQLTRQSIRSLADQKSVRVSVAPSHLSQKKSTISRKSINLKQKINDAAESLLNENQLEQIIDKEEEEEKVPVEQEAEIEAEELEQELEETEIDMSDIKTGVTGKTYISMLQKQLAEERQARQRLENDLDDLKKISGEITSQLSAMQKEKAEN